MANVTIEVPDEQILELVERTRGLECGDAVRPPQITLQSQPPVSNSKVSHLVTVTLTYAFELGEIDPLIRA